MSRWLMLLALIIIGENLSAASRPNVIVILPWNLKDEVVTQLAYAREWGARFATAVPSLRVV